MASQNPNLPERAGAARPRVGTGERTRRQSGTGGMFSGDVPIIATGHEMVSRRGCRSGSAVTGTPGLPPCPAGTYAVYRQMLRDPTIALARAVVFGPLFGSAWSYVRANADVPQEWLDFAREAYTPHETALKSQLLRALDFGARSFEQVYGASPIGGQLRIVVDKFKPLRPELTKPLVDAQTGAYAGLRNGGVDLEPEETLHYAYDVEDDDWTGTSRLENLREDAWWPWRCHQDTAYRLGFKASAIVPIIKGPISEEEEDGRGNKITGEKAAQTILDALTSGVGVFMDNFASSDQLLNDPTLAKASRWVVEWFDSGSSSQAIEPTIGTMRYYDSLKLRGYLRPERTATEGQHGTKAEVAEQADVGLAEGEQLHLEMVKVVNWHSVDRLLAWNFGERARGQVMIEPAPLIDEKRAIFKWIWTAMLANPGIIDLLASKIDLDATAESLGIPTTGPINPDSGDLDDPADPFAELTSGQPPIPTSPAAVAASRAKAIKRIAAVQLLGKVAQRAVNREKLKGKRMKRKAVRQ